MIALREPPYPDNTIKKSILIVYYDCFHFLVVLEAISCRWLLAICPLFPRLANQCRPMAIDKILAMKPWPVR
jgi:hypothetical protein